MKLKHLIKLGVRSLRNWHSVQVSQFERILAVDDCTNHRTLAIDAKQVTGAFADEIYAEIISDLDDLNLPLNRDRMRYEIWEIGYDKKDDYYLYIMLDNESAYYVFLASGPSHIVYRTSTDMLYGFFDVR